MQLPLISMKKYLRITAPLLLLQLFAKAIIILPLAYHPYNSPLAFSFGAISDGKKVIVSFTSPNEKNFESFTIERSQDAINFVAALTIKGSEKINNLIDYTDIDYNPYTGISYYRIKQTDFSGQSFYSETILVNYEVNKEGSLVPFSNNIPSESELEEIKNKMILVVLRNEKGEEFISKIIVSSEKETLVGKNNTEELPSGKYIIVASSYNRICCQQIAIH
jgi:hypothetical protein